MEFIEQSNPYRDFNQWLYPQIQDYDFWTDDQFGGVISGLRTLPLPDTESRRGQLRASWLPATLSHLAKTIGKTFFFSSPTAKPRLQELWAAARPFAGSLNHQGYAAFLLGAVKMTEDRPEVLVDIALSAAESGLKPKGFRWYPSRPLERGFQTAALVALRSGDKYGLRNALAAANAVRVALPARTWGLLAKTAGDEEDEDGLFAIWELSVAARAAFGSREWGSFFGACRRTGRGDLLGQVWEACTSAEKQLDEVGRSVFAAAARGTGRSDLLGQMLSGYGLEQGPESLEPPSGEFESTEGWESVLQEVLEAPVIPALDPLAWTG